MPPEAKNEEKRVEADHDGGVVGHSGEVVWIFLIGSDSTRFWIFRKGPLSFQSSNRTTIAKMDWRSLELTILEKNKT